MGSYGYHLVASNYGHRATGYMGVCVAYPTHHFAAVDVELKRVGDDLDDAFVDEHAEKQGRQASPAAGANAVKSADGVGVEREKRQDEGSGWLASVFKALRPFGSRGAEGTGKPVATGSKSGKPSPPAQRNSSPRDVTDVWDESRKRFNVMINVKLQCLTGEATTAAAAGEEDASAPIPPGDGGGDGDIFVVSNYHMPCVFWSQPVMVIHSSTAMQLALKFASRKVEGESGCRTYPTVFAGDFNIKPQDAAYRLMTTGHIDADR